MIALLLILIPLLTGLTAFFLKSEKIVRAWSLFSSVITLLVSILGVSLLNEGKYLAFRMEWLEALGSHFSVKLDGMGQLLCLLTAIAYPLVLMATWKNSYKKAAHFFGWMLLAQAGLMGVFLSMDALLFYFFWELALVPMYFLCSQWGGEKRIAVTFKFFIYTFAGSVLMLIGILYVYAQTPDRSFDIASFYKVILTARQQNMLFWLFFSAFAVKMPIFPFHTWQPDTYEQSPAATTMILSGVMVKMGVLGLIRWLLPVLPIASFQWGDVVSSLAITGMIYASLIAIQQNDLKKLVAYSSIVHMGLMCAAVFAENKTGMQGVMIQMFNHGIAIIGLWIVVDLIEKQTGTRKISELGGLAQKAPALTLFAVIIALANIAVPLTSAFPGEFLMFNGLFGSTITKYYLWFTVLAGTSIILGAVYILNMLRKVFYGDTNSLSSGAVRMTIHEKIALVGITILIFWLGINPQSLLNLTNELADTILKKAEVIRFIKGS